MHLGAPINCLKQKKKERDKYFSKYEKPQLLLISFLIFLLKSQISKVYSNTACFMETKMFIE